MEKIEPIHQARSADVIVEGDTAVIAFLTAIDGYPNISVSMDVAVLERLQTRIARALAARPKEPSPE
jgi:hypothetical protein